MSFQAPAFLLALALVPLAAIAYGAAQRRRRAAADAFAGPAVRASALPRTPGWRRHAPIALYGAALAALAIALARPEATVAVPTEQATVVLAIDRSGSMRATDVAPSRLAAVKSAAARFLDSVPRRVKVGAVTYNGRPDVLEAPATDRAPVRAAIEAIEAKGGTASGDGLAAALDLIARGGADRPPAAVVLISDGKSTRGQDPVTVAREGGVPVYTVALGTPEGTVVDAEGTTHQATPDPETMQAVAEASGGQSFTVEDADRLSAVYDRLGSQVATEREPREITAAFAGGALLLVAGGALLSLHWFRRLVCSRNLSAAAYLSLVSGPLDWLSMGSRTTRSVFAVALCSGVAMVGASVHGLLGVDTELQRSAFAAQQTIEQQHQTIRVIDRGDCEPPREHSRI